MKYFSRVFLLTTMAASLFACDKKDTLTTYSNGVAPSLTLSSTTIAPQPADSNAVAFTATWTNPNYATDTSKYKFIIQIDSATKNFSNPFTKTVTGTRSTGFIAKELNAFLVNRGYAFGTPVTMEARVISSYANNNERLQSNTVTIKMTPYKVPPKVALPTTSRLFIVGDASTFGWSNDAAPAFPPAREFTRLDETTWGGVFYMNGSGGYKILQQQGNWDTQYHMISGGTATSGDFELKNADPAFPSPATAGWYKVTFDFQQGKYTVTSFGSNALPQQLYATGDATASGWTENPPATQKFTRLNAAEYEISLPLTPGKYMKFLSSPGNWQPQFGGTSATGGTLAANYGGGQDPDGIPTPTVAGTYKIRVNFYTGKYSITQ